MSLRLHYELACACPQAKFYSDSEPDQSSLQASKLPSPVALPKSLPVARCTAVHFRDRNEARVMGCSYKPAPPVVQVGLLEGDFNVIVMVISPRFCLQRMMPTPADMSPSLLANLKNFRTEAHLSQSLSNEHILNLPGLSLLFQ